MTDPSTNNATPADPPKGFPFVTALATLATLFVFVGLVVLAYNSPNYLDETKNEKGRQVEPRADPAAKLDEVKARNEAALDGVGAKMSLREAHGKMLATVKQPTDKMPFPTPEPPVAAPEKDDKEKKP
jgi:hypothetical protein